MENFQKQERKKTKKIHRFSQEKVMYNAKKQKRNTWNKTSSK